MGKLVIFDCDGVLVDSEGLANQALVDCLADVEIQMTLTEAIALFKGRKLADCFREIERIRCCTLPESFEVTLRSRMSEYFESKLQSVDGVEAALKLPSDFGKDVISFQNMSELPRLIHNILN